MNVLPFLHRARSVIDRFDAETDPALGCRPEDRSVLELLQGAVVNLDKPAGPTSRKAADRVSHLLGAGATGHSGTLDPKVTGVLPVGVGRARKVLSVLLQAGKEYEGTMVLHRGVGHDVLAEAASRFVGPIVQTPPVRSAVVRRPRTRHVYYFDLGEAAGRRVPFRAGVEAGTYIRKLIHDLGVALGSGAHMETLRRTRAGPFSLDDGVTLSRLEEAVEAREKGDEAPLARLLVPPVAATEHLGRLWVVDGAVEALCTGALLYLPGLCRLTSGIAEGDTVAILTLKGELVALAQAVLSSEEMASGERGEAARVRRVVMEAGTYTRA